MVRMRNLDMWRRAFDTKGAVRGLTLLAILAMQWDLNRSRSKGREVVLLGAQPVVEKARTQSVSIWKDLDSDAADSNHDR